jgi:alditol oxidase
VGDVGTTWAGSHTYRAHRLHQPSTLDEVRALAAGADRVRVLGSRHSFTDIADSAELVSLGALPTDIVVDRTSRTVAFGAGMTYSALAAALHEAGLALHAMASLPHISVGGAVATATHGSGDRTGNLATAVTAVELVTSTGDLFTARRGEADFDGVVVGLGALGAVTRLTLEVEPAYEVSQQVFRDLPWETALDHLDEVTASGDSVSIFTRWGSVAEQVWVKTRVTADASPPRRELLGAPAADEQCHPIAGMDPSSCTPQRGVAGPWWERLAHFRTGFVPSSGAELQSELFVPRAHAVPALRRLLAMGPRISPLLQVSEIRTVAADELWMSPQHDGDTLAVHFTWQPQPEAVGRLLPELEAALAPFEARPHWGKLFAAEASTIAARYRRLPDFLDLAERLDPRRAFRNAWFERRILGLPAGG